MSILWVLTVLIMVSVIGASLWRKGQSAPQEIGTAPEFELTDQDGNPATLATFAGHAWIADFVFTHCAGPCPIMTAKMASLQKELPASVRLASFTVDPQRDTPAVLKEYAKSFDADEARWRFLTGSQDAIMAAARGMLLTAIPAEKDSPPLHDERFVLIDAYGKIRGAYHAKDAQKMDALKRDAIELAESGGR